MVEEAEIFYKGLELQKAPRIHAQSLGDQGQNVKVKLCSPRGSRHCHDTYYILPRAVLAPKWAKGALCLPQVRLRNAEPHTAGMKNVAISRTSSWPPCPTQYACFQVTLHRCKGTLIPLLLNQTENWKKRLEAPQMPKEGAGSK